MGRFIVFSVALHLVVFYTNIHKRIKTNFEEVVNATKLKIAIVKIRDVTVEKFSVEKVESVNNRLSDFKVDLKRELVLLEKKEEPVKQKVDTVTNFTKQSANLNVPPPYLVPVYSSEKVGKKLGIESDMKKDFNANVVSTQVIPTDPNIYKIKDDIGKKIDNNKNSDEKFKQYVQLYRDEVFTIVYRKFERYTKNKKFVNKNDTVILSVSIDQNGKILSVDVKQSSEDEQFNKLCIDVIKDVAKFPPFPKVLDVEIIKLTIPFRIKLP